MENDNWKMGLSSSFALAGTLELIFGVLSGRAIQENPATRKNLSHSEGSFIAVSAGH
jgi:hypothetical protein